MAPSALNKAFFALALGMAALGHGDPRVEEQLRKGDRAQNGVWQLLFGQRAVREAEKQLGKPYLWGAKDGGKGFDCSGLTAYVYGTLGVALPPYALGQYGAGAPIERGGLQAGDLIFFSGQGSPLHVGIYGGNGRFIHAPGSGKAIQWAGVDEPYFRGHYIGARRVAPSYKEAQRQRATLPAELRDPLLHGKQSSPPSKEKAP